MKTIRIYNKNKAERIIKNDTVLIERICCSCHVPAPFIKTVLMMEVPEIDLMDFLADAAVEINWLRYLLFRTYHPKRHSNNPFRKYDSSTGYCQIFSQVAIESIVFARERGILAATDFSDILTAENPDSLRSVWFRLKRDKAFNMTCCALNLLFCAYQMTGKIDFTDYSDNDIKLIFSRYNGNVKKITAYGEKAFLFFREFCT